jgi:type VI secretion system protein ImpL
VGLGLLLLVLIIWFVGPYFAFADAKPLEGVAGRLVAILVLVSAYALYILLRHVRNTRNNQRLADEVSKQAGTAEDAEAARTVSGETARVNKRFVEAIETLKRARRGTGLYDLPWYVIIGPPGSGKTTVLVNSGLNFPLAQKFGKEALQGVGGTRSCDWWFTDEAILLDTAGRYTTQDSNERADAAGWTAFLQLLRKYRWRQPINGVIVAMSAADLLTLGEREREQHANAIRLRLEELRQNLKIEFPVYFLVTKCDLIAGFNEFFEELGEEARRQVWGVTFALDVSASRRAAEGLTNEFDRLIERLQQRVVPRIQGERDPRRRVSVLAFPRQMTLLKPLCIDLLKRVFTTSEFDDNILLRGVYFTSGTQEGAPIDRLLGTVARTFGVAGALPPPAPGGGKAYFIERLLRNVLFQEAGLAGVNRKLQAQKLALHYAAYAACVGVLFFGLIALFVSYAANANYIDEVARAAAELKTTEFGGTTAGLPLEAFLPRLDALRAVSDVAEKYQEGAPWRMRMGLFRGNSLGAAAHDAYLREINGVLAPFLAEHFEQQLQANAAVPDRLYEYLKGYLMLGQGAHRDPQHLRFLAGVEWSRLYPQNDSLARRFADHFQQLFAAGDHLKSQAVNQDLIQQARSALHNAALPLLMYSRLKLSYADDSKRALRLDIASGSGGPLILVRRSGKPLSEPIPALYTRIVFDEVNAVGKYRLVKQFADDMWVFGDGALDVLHGRQLIDDVLDAYEQDYIATWEAVLKDVMLKPTSNVRDLTEVLGIAGSPASPLKGLLNLVDAQTSLLGASSSADAAAKLVDRVSDRSQILMLAKTFGRDPDAGAHKPGAKVTAYFAPIHQLVAGTEGHGQLDALLAALTRAHDQLQSIGSGVGETSALDALTKSGQVDALQNLALVAKQLPAAVTDMIGQFSIRTASVTSTEAHVDLARRYDEQVSRECQQLIATHYPLSRDSSSDVPLDDFAHVFGPSGVFETFFRENLAALVDTTHSPWQWRRGAAPIGGSNAILRQFEIVKSIRESYFREGAAIAEVRFSLTPESLDATATRFTLNAHGQSMEYRHGPQQSRPFVWPGTSTDVSFNFEDSGGTTPGAELQGPWAWFRLLDHARVEHISDTRYRITLVAGGRSMRLVLDAASARNPFGKNPFAGFHCTMEQ